MHVPDFKRIPGTNFTVDGFKYPHNSVEAYFLSHAHSDHYSGITEKWGFGPIWCTPLTGKLVCHITGVRKDFIRPLPLDTPTKVHDVEVTAIDANHCPGAAVLLFHLPDGRRYVHCGDMRYDPKMAASRHLRRFVGCNGVFLDTTYCAPKHTFPPQSVSVEAVGQLCKQYLAEGDPARVIMISAYTIGKERLFLEVFRRCGTPLLVTAAKLEILQLLDWPPDAPWNAVFTTEVAKSRVHVVGWNWIGDTWPYFRPNYQNMELHALRHGATSAVGIVPTGWTYQMKNEDFPVHEKAPWKIHLIPYSEHSSYPELLELVRFLRPSGIIPTVGVSGDKADSNVRRMLEHFRHLCDATAAKRAFLGKLGPVAVAAPSATPCGGTPHDREDAAQTWGTASEPLEQAPPIGGPDNGGALFNGADDVALVSWNERGGDVGREAGISSAAGISNAQSGRQRAGRERTVSSGSPAGLVGGASTLEWVASKDVTQVCDVLGSTVSAAHAAVLLQKGRGSVAAAVALHYDGSNCTEAAAANPRLVGMPAGGASQMEVSGRRGEGAASAGKSTPTKRRAGSTSSPASQKRGKTAGPQSAAGSRQQQTLLGFLGAAKNEEGGGGLGQELPADRVAQARGGDVTLRPLGKPGGKAGAGTSSDTGSGRVPCAHTHAGPDPAGWESERQSRPGVTAPTGAGPLPPESGRQSQESKPPTAGAALPEEPQVPLQPELHVVADPIAADPVEEAVLKPLPKYHPREDACWPGGAVPYRHVANALAAMDGTTKRLRIADALTNMFRAVMAICAADLECVVYLVLGRIAPDYEGGELQVGGSTVSAAITDVTGVTGKRLSELYVTLGDLGDVAAQCKSRQSMLRAPPLLTARGVFEKLQELSGTRGAGSAARKQQIIASLLRACRGAEVKYLTRTLIRNLRVGANWRSVISALGRAAACHQATGSRASSLEEGTRAALPVPPKSELDAAAQAVLDAFHRCPNVARIVEVLMDGGVAALESCCGVQVAVPIRPMLARITEGFTDCARQIEGQAVLAEFKYDGQRAQIHICDGGKVKVFSRHCEDKTAMFPDVAAAILLAAGHPAACPIATQPATVPPTRSCIVDAELVAVDRADGNRLRAFQELSTRARGGASEAVAEADVSIHVCIFLFDLLALAGDSLLDLSLRERRRRLREAFPALSPGHVQLAQCVELRVPVATGTRRGPAGRGQGDGSLGALDDSMEEAGAASPDEQRAREASTAGGSEHGEAAAGPGESPSGQEEARGGRVASCADGIAGGSLRREARGAQAHEVCLETGGRPPGGPGEDAREEVVACAQVPESSGPSASAPHQQMDEPGPVEEDTSAAAQGLTQVGEEAGGSQSGADVAGWGVLTVPRDRTEAVLEAQLLQAVAAGTEGLMLKFLDARSAYQPSRRSEGWLKVKKDYCESLRDSLDLVPIGAWYGNGRKAGWYSPYLLAAWDPDREEFQSVCRVMSGFSDAFYAASRARLDEHHLLPGPRPYYATHERPDVWFEAAEVWEIRGADLTLSPVHMAAHGRVHEARGISLRFPRFIRVREDKNPEDASDPGYIVSLYHAQTRKSEAVGP